MILLHLTCSRNRATEFLPLQPINNDSVVRIVGIFTIVNGMGVVGNVGGVNIVGILAVIIDAGGVDEVLVVISIG